MTLRIAHRGAAGTHPENTMAAFRRALELGADGAEFDIHRTKDGHLVVIHDDELHRTTDGTGHLSERTLAEIKQLDAGSWKDPSFAGERVPTLVELIRATPAHFKLFLELKAGSRKYPGIEQQVVDLLRAEGAAGRTQVSSFDHKALRTIHAIAPELELGMLFGTELPDPVGLARQIGASALHPFYFLIMALPDMLKAAHAAGLKVNVWTVNLPEHIAAMKAAGVDGIMSDYPELL